MAIKIKTIERAQPGILGGGIKKYYLAPERGQEISFEGLAQTIEKACTLTKTDILAVLNALVEEAAKGLLEGKAIRLGDLGTLRISISSEGNEKPEKLGATSVRNARVLFAPGKILKKMIQKAEFAKV